MPVATKRPSTVRAGRSFQVMSGVIASTQVANTASAEAKSAPKTSSSTPESSAVRTAGSQLCTPALGRRVRASQGSPRSAARGTAMAEPTVPRTEVALVEPTATRPRAASRHSTVIHAASRSTRVSSSSATRAASTWSGQDQRRPAPRARTVSTVPQMTAATRTVPSPRRWSGSTSAARRPATQAAATRPGWRPWASGQNDARVARAGDDGGGCDGAGGVRVLMTGSFVVPATGQAGSGC